MRRLAGHHGAWQSHHYMPRGFHYPSRSQVRFLPLICTIALILVWFQPAFGSYFGEFSFKSDDPAQLTRLISMASNMNSLDWGAASYYGVSNTYYYSMLLLLAGATLLFAFATFFLPRIGRLAALACVVYVGLNIFISTQNPGIGFSTAGIIAVAVAIGYFLGSRNLTY